MTEDIGKKIHNLRMAADLTQEELASRAGLTDGFISQMERGKTSISIDSLKMILDALNVSLAEFFSDGHRARVVFSGDDRVEMNGEGSGRMQLLVPGATNRNMEPALLELAPGTGTTLRTPFRGDCFGYVLNGRIWLHLGREKHKVRAGECFYFPADREHRIDNPYKRSAVLLWLTSPPCF